MQFIVWGFLIIPSLGWSFGTCTSYFSNTIVNGQNIPLSKIMQKLQGDSWDITNFVRKAKKGSFELEEKETAFRAVESFLRMAEAMNERFDTTLAPGISFELSGKKREQYLKVYQKYTNRFYRLSADLYEAILSERWDFANEVLSKIEEITVEAHQKVNRLK